MQPILRLFKKHPLVCLYSFRFNSLTKQGCKLMVKESNYREKPINNYCNMPCNKTVNP